MSPRKTKVTTRRRVSAQEKIRVFLERNVGKVVTSQEIGKAAGISDYQRRIRELRNDKGMQISSCKNRHDLKPNEYILESLNRIPVFGEGVSPRLRTEILERNGYTCQLCGATANDPDPFNPSRKLTLHIDHISVRSQGGKANPDNLRTLCSACNAGRQNLESPSETAKNLLARIRRASRPVQREVFKALEKSFMIK